MQTVELKLKQASAVLGVDPKDLQNLVQFKVLHPPRRDSFYWFDNRLLLEAKVAFYLKESLGTSTEVLARFTQALSDNLKEEEPTDSGTCGFGLARRQAASQLRCVFLSETWLGNSNCSFLALPCTRICPAEERDRDGSASLHAV